MWISQLSGGFLLFFVCLLVFPSIFSPWLVEPTDMWSWQHLITMRFWSVQLYSYLCFFFFFLTWLKTCLGARSQPDWTAVVPAFRNSYLNCKPLWHKILMNEKSRSRQTYSLKNKESEKYKILYQCFEQRWCRIHATRFCNIKGSFLNIRDPGFAWEIQRRKNKNPWDREMSRHLCEYFCHRK